ncbi:MAG: aldehyde dehydrogenase [Vallitalea sp.]|jgi:aldehyde dehydrogenase (NAD+)|nr:aldehyde dehydrogenase [Vallitalea sp.]
MISSEHVRIQREYFLSGITKDYNFRIRQLKKLKKVISDYEEEILDALYKDLGKNNFEGYMVEIGTVYEEINHNIKRLRRWMKPQKVKTPISQFGAKSYIYSEPRGVVLIISPWNYPFNLTITPLIGAMAAGNTCLVKTSRNSPNVSKIIAKIIEEAFYPEYIAILKGGSEQSMEVIGEGIDYVFFTGSPRIGKVVMTKAADNLVPVTLELGGKSPVIVDKSANIKMTTLRLAWGKFLNSGQTCIAPDHVYVHKDIKNEFIENMKKAIEKFYGTDPISSKSFGKIINEKQFDRLLTYLDESKIVYGGNYDKDKMKISPTIMNNITYDDAVMKDEIFGPILPVLEFEDIDEVIKEINSKPRPLALYCFADDKKIYSKVTSSVSYGGGCINDTISHIANVNLPFGGNGNSGMGSYHGEASFDTFSHKKSILKKSTKINITLPFPPYSKDKMKKIKMVMK